MLRCVILVCVTFITLVAASDVIVLTDAKFKSLVQGDIMLVEFYAPWCGHCKRLAPEYETAATELKKNDPPVPLAKIDCTEGGTESCSKYGVSGYPTLKIFRNGELSGDYNGPREAKGIVSYMRKQAGPSSKEVKSDDELVAYLKKSTSATLVGFFADDSDFAKTFQNAASKMRDTHRFAHTKAAAVLDKYGYKNAVVLFRPPLLKSKFEEQQIKYSGDESTHGLETFFKKNCLGLAGVMTDDNKDDFGKPVVIALFDVDYVKNPKGTNYYRNRIMKVAKEVSANGIHLNYAIANKDQFSQIIEEFGASPSDDIVIGIKDAKGGKFAMSDSFRVESFKEFLTKFSNGELKPYLKSEAEPASNDGPVKVVVGTTFDKIVNDPTKDVLIEFYAPWCGHCKSLAPKYEELGKKLSGNDHIVIAKMDATANDVPSQYDVQGFPTIYWAPANNKDSPARYEGGREVSDFVDYIKQRSTSSVKLGKKKKKSEL